MRRLSILTLCLVGLCHLQGGEAAKTVSPFNGKDLTGWKTRSSGKDSWGVGTASIDEKNPSQFTFKPGAGDLVNHKAGGTDLYTEAAFGDVVVELECMYPRGSNSGVYLMGNYEVQILDSFGKEKVGPGDLGGIYTTAAPRSNASKKPGEWQKFVIDFQAPRFQGDKKTSNAKFVKVELNGVVIHENVEMKGPTGGAMGKEVATGPLMFQGDHGAVAIRNLKITPKSK